MSTITVDVANSIATITLRRPATLNSLTAEDYSEFANALRAIDRREDVLVTVWQATGKWFCAGTDVRASKTTGVVDHELRDNFLRRVVQTTTDCGQALYSHSKILVAALNGPVMYVNPFLGYFDFIYCMPNAWLSVPFTFLGNCDPCSFGMGLAKANEVLIWGKKKGAQELHECGFINQIFPLQSTESFQAAVRDVLLEELRGLDPTALLVVKRLIRAGLTEKNNPDAVNLRESYGFRRIATREIKHKL
ncbi:ClpP/crotonase-like domain-containing protein [Mycena haematopus]|nr:ClpP/crotonase-like domain-containing protein [Mycena haematopus]